MHVRQINLSNDGIPEKITVEMTASEALFITLLIGKQNDITSNAIMPNGPAVLTELYNAMTGELFNRYWDGGADGALTDLRAT